MAVAGSTMVRASVLLPLLMLLACDRRPATTAATAPSSQPAARVSRIGDHLLVEVTDLTPGDTNRIPVRISEKGEIRLPLIGDLRVVDLTTDELEKAIKKAYADPGIVRDVHPSVKFED
jgi:protein involved in polysaccharide export with SLBB domain